MFFQQEDLYFVHLVRAAPDRKDNDKSLSLVSDYLHVTLQSNKSFPLRPPEWESGSGSAQAGAQSTSGHRGKNVNTRIKIYRDVLCQEYQSVKSRYWNIQSLEVSTDNPHIRREACGDDLRGEQSLPGGQAGGGGAGGCGGGVTCHVWRVKCHVSRVTMMFVSVSSCYNLAPGHHPRLPPPQCPLHHRKGDDRCGNVIVCCNMLLYQHNECNRPLPRRAGQVAVAGERGGPGHPRHLPGGRDHGALHRVSHAPLQSSDGDIVRSTKILQVLEALGLQCRWQ